MDVGGWNPDHSLIALPCRPVRLCGQGKQCFKEILALAGEEAGVRQERGCSCCASKRDRSRPNYRTEGQIVADESAWTRHNEIRCRVGIGVEIGEHETIAAVDRRSVPCLVVPDFEVGHFRSLDAGHDSQRCEAAAFEAEGVVKTGSALFNHREVKGGGVGDRLDLVRRVKGRVLRRNRRAIDDVDDLTERVAEIRVPCASIAQIPARIDVQVHQIRQARFLHRRYGTARQGAERLQIDRFFVHLHQERVQEILVAEFIIGVLRDVGGHVVVDSLQGVGVRAVHVRELVVLLPQISLEYFGGCEEAQNVRIAFGDAELPLLVIIVLIALVALAALARQRACDRSEACATNGKRFQEEAALYAVPEGQSLWRSI